MILFLDDSTCEVDAPDGGLYRVRFEAFRDEAPGGRRVTDLTVDRVEALDEDGGTWVEIDAPPDLSQEVYEAWLDMQARKAAP